MTLCDLFVCLSDVSLPKLNVPFLTKHVSSFEVNTLRALEASRISGVSRDCAFPYFAEDSRSTPDTTGALLRLGIVGLASVEDVPYREQMAP